MAEWVSLSDVEEKRAKGITMQFPPCLVWAANYTARNPYPRKFVYSSCPHRENDGHRCGKSLEWGSKCGHYLPGKPAFRFQLVLFDAIHGGVQPVKVLLWNCASILLKYSAMEFSVLPEIEQMAVVHDILQQSPRLQVSLEVKGFEVHIQRLNYVDAGIPRTPTKTPVKLKSTPGKPNSAAKILANLIMQLKNADLDK